MSGADTTTHVWEPDPFKGKVIGGKYQVLEPLGRGGMGRVYVARDLRLARKVALKILSEDLAGQKTYIERFKREARAAAGIGHPNIVQVFDIDQTEEGVPYQAMELLRGHDLHVELEQRAYLSVEQVVDIAGQVLFALSAAHRAGIVHRDLKPENIFLTERAVSNWHDLSESEISTASEVVKILDFGISRFIGSVSDSSKLTATGVVIGTPQYMAPEQIRPPHEVDGRADLYAVGIIMYLSLTGRPPYVGDNPFTILHHVLNNPTPNVREIRPEIPEGLAEVIEQAMAKDRLHRFRSADEFITALRPYCAGGGSVTLSDRFGAPAAATIADSLPADLTPTVLDDDPSREMSTQIGTDREFPPQSSFPLGTNAPLPSPRQPGKTPAWALGHWQATEDEVGRGFELTPVQGERLSSATHGFSGQRLAVMIAVLSVAALALAATVFLVLTLLLRGGQPSGDSEEPSSGAADDAISQPTEPATEVPQITPVAPTGTATEPAGQVSVPVNSTPPPAPHPGQPRSLPVQAVTSPVVEPLEPPASGGAGGQGPPVVRTPPQPESHPRPPERPRYVPTEPEVPVAREAPW
jgi:serine/threonine-protein kinase